MAENNGTDNTTVTKEEAPATVAVTDYTAQVGRVVNELQAAQAAVGKAEKNLTAEQEKYGTSVAEAQALSDEHVAKVREESAKYMSDFKAEAKVPVDTATNAVADATDNMIALYDKAVESGYISPVSAQALGVTKPRRARRAK